MCVQVEHLRQELGAMTRARDEERARAGQLDTRLTAQDIQMRNRLEQSVSKLRQMVIP